MQGQANVVDYLKVLLKGELAARDQYFLHSRMYADWGFTKLYERINHEMEEETQHADVLLQRILFLEGSPDMTPEAIHPGADVPATQLTRTPTTENSMGLRLGNLPEIRNIIQEELEKAFQGQQDARQALDSAVKRGNAVLRNFERANKG